MVCSPDLYSDSITSAILPLEAGSRPDNGPSYNINRASRAMVITNLSLARIPLDKVPTF